jgi:hypothetical protein
MMISSPWSSESGRLAPQKAEFLKFAIIEKSAVIQIPFLAFRIATISLSSSADYLQLYSFSYVEELLPKGQQN